jgi:hypothetical protein
LIVAHKLEQDKVYRHFIERTRLGSLHKLFLYGSVGALWLSGLIWLLFHYFGRHQGDFGDMPLPIEPLMLKIHGAFAMAILLVLGALASAHIRRGWVLKRNRPSGVVITSACAALAISGWMLYYVANEQARNFVSAAHWIVGLALPLIIVLHILMWKWEQNRA